MEKPSVEDIIEFNALITYCRYYNDSTMWGVYGFETKDDIPFFQKVSNDCLFDDEIEEMKDKKFSTLAGRMQELVIGGEYFVKAVYKNNATYGDQYSPIAIYAVVPKTEESQLLFLQSLISPTIAENLIKAYPTVVEDVINKRIDEIDYSKVKGVGKATWMKIKDKIINNYLISDIIALLMPLGVTYTMVKTLINDEPNPAILKQQIETNPYILCKIKGLGFKRVDGLALKIKPELLNSSERLVAYVKYYLTEIGESDGHTWCLLKTLSNAVQDNIPECYDKFNWMLDNNEFLYLSGDKVGLLYYHDIETEIFNILKNKIDNKLSFELTKEQIEKAVKEAETEQGFKYTQEQIDVIYNTLNSNVSIISGKAGCVDCDTEFFNGYGWKKISDYHKGDKVLQYNKDSTAELVTPYAYIKQEKEYLWHFKTKYGIDQCLSENHTCVLISLKNKIKKEKFESIMKRQNNLSFHDRFITTFQYNGTGIDLSDNMIRLLVAISADGSYNYNIKNKTSNTYNRARIRLKKARKISRLINIIKKANIDFEISNFANDDYVNIFINLPFRFKEFPDEWYNCSKHQLEIIADEIMYWDADIKEKNRYFTTIKSNADFVQFVFTSLGKRATILTEDRGGRIRNINGIDYETKSIDYVVTITDRKYVSLCSDRRKNHTPTKFEKYKTKDGFEYCFTVPSHMLVLRRNDRIFITGNCGKTSIMRAIIKAFTQNNKSLCASSLSAMAAKRIGEATGYPAMTIHRTLGCTGPNQFEFTKENPMTVDVAFMDEGSMTNAGLFLSWLEGINNNTRIIICGDHKQLPPIGYGNIFSDLIEKFNKKYVNELTKPMRQAEMSGILSDANLIRENINPLKELKSKIVTGELHDMYYMFRTNRESLFTIAIKTFFSSIETDGIDNVVIITPRKNNCLNSTFEINKVIQNNLLKNIPKEKCITTKNGDITFKLGAKVMQTVNDYDKGVFNGEIGYIVDVGVKFEGKKEKEYCTVKYIDTSNKEKFVDYEKNELGALDLAYAMTCHKCQGQGIPTVIGIIDNTHYQLLDNCLLYTMLTRAKKRCLLLAEPQAFLKCIRTSHNNRNTWLSLRRPEE